MLIKLFFSINPSLSGIFYSVCHRDRHEMTSQNIFSMGPIFQAFRNNMIFFKVCAIFFLLFWMVVMVVFSLTFKEISQRMIYNQLITIFLQLRKMAYIIDLFCNLYCHRLSGVV